VVSTLREFGFDLPKPARFLDKGTIIRRNTSRSSQEILNEIALAQEKRASGRLQDLADIETLTAMTPDRRRCSFKAQMSKANCGPSGRLKAPVDTLGVASANPTLRRATWNICEI
jgi:hypothetical protein